MNKIGVTLAAALVAGFPTLALSQDKIAETRDMADMMIASAYACSQYLDKPEVLDEWRGRARDGLIGAGMAEAEANSAVDELVAANQARTFDKTQQQVGCEMVNIPVLKTE